MSTQVIEKKLANLERRLAAVELAAKRPKKPAWLQHAGWAANDPLYDEAMRLGAQWRKAENKKSRTHARRR